MAERICSTDGCERKHTARGLCLMHWKREHGKRTRYPAVCEVCGKDYLSSRRDGRFCTDSCKGIAYRTMSRCLVPTSGGTCMLPDKHPIMRLLRAQHRESPSKVRSHLNVIVCGRCAWCAQTFAALTASGDARYCSHRCARASGKARREQSKGQFYISPVARLAIYDRDQWVCQLCLDSVDPDLMGTSHDWAPSLDHIECQSWTLIPDHSDDNLRLTHRWCNSVRGAGNHADLFISPAA